MRGQVDLGWAHVHAERYRMALSDGVRATVFERDKAICAFSGLSLWLLDHGASPDFQGDWPDHIKPASRGGKDTPENLVCASHFYNQKKGNNGRDNAYLFMKGRPTDIFFWNRHILTPAQGDMMRRQGSIVAEDWYFNRAVFNVMVGVHTEWAAMPVSRQPDNWQRSALKRLNKWRKLGGASGPSFVDRGLVRYPAAPDVGLLLSLAHADSEKQVAAIHKRLLRHYRANAGAIESFVAAPSRVARERSIKRAEAARWTTEPLLEVMRTNLSAMADMDGPLMSLWL